MKSINSKFIISKKWYHQRFDGCPQLILVISEAELKKEKRKYSWGSMTSHWGYFSNDRCDWYIDEEDIKRITAKFIYLSKTKNNISKEIIKRWEKDEIKLYKYCKHIESLDLSLASDKELHKIYNEMLHRSIMAVTSSSLIDGFALGVDNYLADSINNILQKKELDKEAQRYFALLTAPTRQSFITQAEIELLKIGLLISKDKKLLENIKNLNLLDILKLLQKNSKLWNKLIKYQKQYYWSRNNYVDNNILSIKFFVKELIAILKQKVDINKEINRLQNTPKRNKLEKSKLLKQLQLPQYLINLLNISDDFTWWQDERKKKTYFYTHYLSLILNEIGKRNGYSLHQMKYVYYDEIDSFFNSVNKKVSKTVLEKRVKSYLWFQKGSIYKSKTGKESKLLIRKLLTAKSKDKVDDFRGMTASKGIAQGTVKIIKSVKECHKVKNGDILVAVMTRPDYIQAMKKAGAIITNEGGVTCHAAIVSRELGIPCIIGTKIATEVLKDGDRVEVNANHGVVTILK